MRIDKPRALPVVEGKVRVGYAQWLALNLLDRVAKGQAAPVGLITPTGVLREHVFHDLAALGLVDMDRPVRGRPMADYYLNAVGREVLRNGFPAEPPKEARKEFNRLMSLIQHIRYLGRGRSRVVPATGARRAA